jgi:hypothetical protein
VLFVSGGEAIFDEETPIAEAVLDLGIVVDDVGRRRYENDFNIFFAELVPAPWRRRNYPQ